MKYGLDFKSEKVGIYKALDYETYFCPLCGEYLIQKKGLVNEWHFAHKTKNNCDDWYTMSEWHTKWQEVFPERFREIPMHWSGEKRIADIKIKNLVIEFQNSLISGSEFLKRCEFYARHNKLIWVFNLEEKNERIRRSNKVGKTTQFVWDWAYKFGNIEKYNQNFDLFFQLNENLLVKVIWNKQSFKYFGGYEYDIEGFKKYIKTKL
jgi:competence CoiA-like predicted nuclease